MSNLCSGPHIDPTANAVAAAALARSARVCKDFQEPALSVLWRDIPSFVVLLGLLSRVKQALGNNVGRSQAVYCDMEPNEWVRFQYYARFVHRCRMPRAERDSWPVIPIDPAIYHALFQHNNSQPIFPCLEELEWSQDASSLHYLLTPFLRRLTVFLRSGSMRGEEEESGQVSCVRQRLLVDILSASPCLSHLALLGAWDEFPGILSSFSLENSVLRSLDLYACGPLSSQVIFQLSCFPALTLLRICTRSPLEAFVQPPAFHNLKMLLITGHAEDLASLLAVATLPSLITLHLFFEDTDDPATAFNTLSGILSDTALSNWSALAVRSTVLAKRRVNPALFPRRSLLAVIRPILALARLRKVYLDFGTFDVSDDDIRQITQSWRKLLTLELCCNTPRSQPRGRVSLRALVHIARNCPSLKKLTLRPLRHDGEVPQITTGDQTALPHGLRALYMYGWQVRPTKEDVVSFTRSLFPNADLLGII